MTGLSDGELTYERLKLTDVVGLARQACRHEDGVCVIPIGCLGP